VIDLRSLRRRRPDAYCSVRGGLRRFEQGGGVEPAAGSRRHHRAAAAASISTLLPGAPSPIASRGAPQVVAHQASGIYGGRRGRGGQALYQLDRPLTRRRSTGPRAALARLTRMR